MKKTALAIAIASVAAMPAAQAAVKVSGIFDVSYNFIDNDGAADGSFQDISSNNTRLIFKGSEDLGNGLKALWQIGQVVRVDGTGNVFDRNTWVGLAGKGWGQVRLGRHESPHKMVGRKVDLFYNRQLGENRILVTPNTTGQRGPNPQFALDRRPSEGLHYFTPTFNGFQASLAYLPEGVSGGAEDGDGWSLGGFYDNGPLYIGVGYEQVNEGWFRGPFNVGGTEDSTSWRLAGSYKFGGGFRAVGFYQDVSDDLGVSGNDWSVWGVGGAYKFGNNTVKAQYYDRDGDDLLDTADATAFSIGFDHNFSKRTMIYATYATVDNDSGAQFSVNSQGFDQGGSATGIGVGPGDDSTGFAIGVSHKF